MKFAFHLLLVFFALDALALNEEACRLYYRRLAAGDRNALVDLIPAIHSQLRGFIYQRVRDKDAVDDIAHDVYEALWTAKSLPREDLRASDWILAIAKNKLRQYYERNRKQIGGAASPEIDVMAESVTRDDPETSGKVYSHLEHELTAALKHFLFSEENVKLLELHAAGVSFPQIAKEIPSLGLTNSGILVRVRSLKEKLDAQVKLVPAVLDRLLTAEEVALFKLALVGNAPNDPKTQARLLSIQDTLTRHLTAFGTEGSDGLSIADRDWLAERTLEPELLEIFRLTEAGGSSPEIVRRLKLSVGDTGVQYRYQRARDLMRWATLEAERVTEENFTPQERELLRLANLGFSPTHLGFRLNIESSPLEIAGAVANLHARQRTAFERPGAVAVDRRTFARDQRGEVVETDLGRGLQARIEKSLGEPRSSFLRYLEAGLNYDEAKAKSGITTETKALTKTVNTWRTKIRGELNKNRDLANGPLDRLSSEEQEFLRLAQQPGGEKAVRDHYGTLWTNLYVWNRAHQIREKLRRENR